MWERGGRRRPGRKPWGTVAGNPRENPRERGLGEPGGKPPGTVAGFPLALSQNLLAVLDEETALEGGGLDGATLEVVEGLGGEDGIGGDVADAFEIVGEGGFGTVDDIAVPHSVGLCVAAEEGYETHVGGLPLVLDEELIGLGEGASVAYIVAVEGGEAATADVVVDDGAVGDGVVFIGEAVEPCCGGYLLGGGLLVVAVEELGVALYIVLYEEDDEAEVFTLGEYAGGDVAVNGDGAAVESLVEGGFG